MKIAPSILSADFAVLGNEISKVKNAGAEYLHIDVMDGVFVRSISYGMPVISSIRKCTDMIFDVHLMIVEPVRYYKEFASAGSDIITFHLEAADDPERDINEIHRLGVKAGISIKPGTATEKIEPFLGCLGKGDIVLLMSVEPGFGGQSFIPESMDRLRKIRELLNKSQCPATLSIDGGVNKTNIAEIRAAGADLAVAGSSVFKGDAAANFSELISE